MSVLNENTIIGASAAGGYEIDNSLRFNDDDSSYLSRTPSVEGNTKVHTFSGWVKMGNLATDKGIIGARNGSSLREVLYLTDFNKLQFYINNGGTATDLTSDMVFRDASAWYHIILAVDTTQGAASNRVKLYVNGEEITVTGNYPAQNIGLQLNNTVLHYVGAFDNGGSSFDGYLAEVNFIDGLALTPDSFGEFGDYGEWKPLRYVGAYGTNGFYLDFKNSGSLGNDAAGSNNWTPTNLAATDQMVDSPTNNFCVMNPLYKNTYSVFSEGNLEVLASGGSWASFVGSMEVSSGKRYIEVLYANDGAGSLLGIANSSFNAETTGTPAGTDSGGDSWSYSANGNKYNANTSVAYGAAYSVGDIVGIALDVDAGTLTFYKNGVSQGVAYSSLPASSYFVATSLASTDSHNFNFGQDSSFAGNKTPQGNSDSNGIGDFYYAPPTGFLALCTQNLPEPTVIPSEHFNTVLWTGNSSTSRALTGIGFQPDFTWIKARSTSNNHNLNDSVRGANKQLYSNLTNAETSQTNNLKSFDSDGFTLGSDGDVNYSPRTYAGWNWKANGAGVSNTDGTITSSVSANVEAGFSIVSYTGTGANATVGHGLSLAPEMVIVKNRSTATYWPVYSSLYNASDYLVLNATSATATASDLWNSTSATSSVFAVGTSSWTNLSSDNLIAYAFHSVDGYSKVGSYTGNGSTEVMRKLLWLLLTRCQMVLNLDTLPQI